MLTSLLTDQNHGCLSCRLGLCCWYKFTALNHKKLIGHFYWHNNDKFGLCYWHDNIKFGLCYWHDNVKFGQCYWHDNDKYGLWLLSGGGCGGFFLMCKDFGRIFVNSFSTCTFFIFFIQLKEIVIHQQFYFKMELCYDTANTNWTWHEQYGVVVVMVVADGGFFLKCKDFGRMFDNSFITCTFSFLSGD